MTSAWGWGSGGTAAGSSSGAAGEQPRWRPGRPGRHRHPRRAQQRAGERSAAVGVGLGDIGGSAVGTSSGAVGERPRERRTIGVRGGHQQRRCR